jgi:hypothetical protein
MIQHIVACRRGSWKGCSRPGSQSCCPGTGREIPGFYGRFGFGWIERKDGADGRLDAERRMARGRETTQASIWIHLELSRRRWASTVPLDEEEAGPGGYRVGMLRWSREVAMIGADAAWPSTKGLELRCHKWMVRKQWERSSWEPKNKQWAEQVIVFPLQCLHRGTYSLLGTYMTVKHNKNTLMGCRHSVVHVCMHDERMVILSMNERSRWKSQ